jgi:hypothetical protein
MRKQKKGTHMRKLAMYALIALIPSVAFAADTSTSVPASGSPATQAVMPSPKTDATVKTDATAKTDTAVAPKAADKGTKVHKVIHKTNAKAKATAPASIKTDSKS